MFSANLKRFRESANLTQEDVAEKCGVDRATISKWETGEFSPRTDKLLVLTRTLNCSIDDLLKEV